MQHIFQYDYETRSEIDLKVQGLDVYSAHPSTRVISAAWAWDDDEPSSWDWHDTLAPPAEFREAIEDPHVLKMAFNAQFERVIGKRVLKYKVPYKNHRCTMALANMHSFTGTLEQIGRQCGIDAKYLKNDQGSRLINKFCKPQKITKTNDLTWRDRDSDPEDWHLFSKIYNPQDVVAERAIRKRLWPYPIREEEWELYEIDQEINDRGFPIDRIFVDNALRMSDRRKDELIKQMRELTGVANPNSGPQFIPWLRKRGYPFQDLKKDTVKKVITEHEAKVEAGGEGFIDDDCLAALKLRQWAARTSTRKYSALQKALRNDNLFRFGHQFAGAARTNRWSGRRFQPHNLARTPKSLEPDKKLAERLGVSEDWALTQVTEMIRDDDYEALTMFMAEPMEGLVGTLRSCIRAPEGQILTVADLSSIETCVTAWLTDCKRLLRVFAERLDPYIDFATFLFNKKYEDVTKFERQIAKPPVLGCTYRLGGGVLRDGKRTGLWGYAESMGVDMTMDVANRAVTVFRATYPEIVECWYAIENAVKHTIRTGKPTTPWFRRNGEVVKMPIKIKYMQPYLMAEMPSGNYAYYYLPRVEWKTFMGQDGEPYQKEVISFMGQNQISKKWGRVDSHGGKFFENFVQKIARDVLAVGMKRAHEEGFKICLHVHDELGNLTKIGDNYFTLQRLIELMTDDIEWCPGLPLRAAGYQEPFYRK